uniref:oligopeptidase A n=1 Tax=Latimeria chalumnae TaxID=7897 RepID=H3ALL0_LATCH
EREDSKDRENPLLDTSGLPRFSDITVSHIVPVIMQLTRQLEEGLQEYEHRLKPQPSDRSWESVEEPLELLVFPLSYSWLVVSHLLSVANSQELRLVHQQVQPVYVNTMTRLAQSFPIFLAHKPIRELNTEGQKLDRVQRRILESFLHGARLAGVELQGGKKQRFNQIQLQLANLTTKFKENVLDATKAFSITLMDRLSVEGIPETARRLLANNAVAGTDRSSDPEKGPWMVTLDDPSYDVVMKHSQDRQLRERLFRARVTRAAAGQFDNSVIIQEIRELRRETAEILGYKNYAELSLSSKMAKNVEAVWDLLNFLHNKSYPVAQRELESLQEFAQNHSHVGELKHWDLPFWAERQWESLFSLTDEMVRPYFPLERVLSGLFKLSSDLLGIRIEPADGTAQVWNPAVRFFYVYDEKGTHIASFYLDPYSRPQEKHSGAWMLGFLDSHNHHIPPLGGGIYLPACLLAISLLPVSGPKPHGNCSQEIELHQFGHGLQHMLTTVPYAAASGINNIEWDAVEIVSQFMENWLYDRDTIMRISGHYQTGEHLPDDMFKQILRGRREEGGLSMLTQLYFAALDMELHSRWV